MLPLLVVALLLAACGAPSVAPFMRPPATPRGQTVEGNLSSARAAWQVLSDGRLRSEWPPARLAYNRALEGAFNDLRRADSDWKAAAAATGTRLADSGPGHLGPELLGTLFPASLVDVSKIGNRKLVAGIGLPVVGWVDEGTEVYQDLPFSPASGISHNVTALLRFDRGPLPTWEFRRPYQSEEIRLGRVGHSLAADWTAAHALYWHMSRLDKHKLTNLLRPERIEGVERLVFAQPLDPDRIPVVFVHGLKSSPDTFARMVNELLAEPWFRRRYQVWYYSYPTGVPWMLSAIRFRHHFAAATELARSRGVRHLDRTVIVGHSMGGLVAAASLRDPGSTVYDRFFNNPLDQLELRADERRLIADGLLWEPLPHTSRAVFLATPHLGSPMADQRFYNWLSGLIALPKVLTVDLADAVLRNAAAIIDPEILAPEERVPGKALSTSTWIPNGVRSLSPERPMFKLLPGLPFRPGLRLHSVIGDQGKGNSPDSSDGVVPYWSSHLPGVDSELIVPSGHSLNGNPEAIQEMKRILRLHAEGR